MICILSPLSTIAPFFITEAEVGWWGVEWTAATPRVVLVHN